MTDASVRVVDRGRVRADMNFVLDGYAVGTASDPDPDHEYAEFAVWNLVVDHPEATVLWDTGIHPEAGDGYWPEPLYEAFAPQEPAEHALEDDLDRAGYSLDAIDAVVMSHLHMDHAGGLAAFADGETPVYVHRDELPYAYFSANTDEGSIAYLASDFDRDLNWEVVHGDRYELLEGVELLHLPGHTPGLLGALVHRDEGSVVVAGDQAYVAPNYEDERPMATSLLWNNRAWFESLKRLKDLERRHDADVLFGHDLDQLGAVGEGWS